MIHPTAIIDPKAEIDPSVRIGPFSIIDAEVKIGAGTVIGPYVHIEGRTEIGPDNHIFTGAMIGLPPQHSEYKGAPTGVKIGRGNEIREHVTIHRAYVEGAATIVGDECILMGGSHVAHDCVVGDRVVMANQAFLAGHVIVAERVFISGLSGVQQFGRVGRLAMIGGHTPVHQDVPPFMMVKGNPPFLRGLNTIGLQRAGLDAKSRRELKRLFQALYRTEKSVREVIEATDFDSLTPECKELIEAYRNPSKNGVTSYQRYRSRG